MKSKPTQSQSDDHVRLEDETSSDDEYGESESLLHDDTSSSEGLSIAETAAATAPRFYARLRTELAKRGISYAALPKFTVEGEAPPCFKAAGVPFDMWLASASLLRATVPYRFDMPAEPNFCFDCVRSFQKEMKKQGKCLFPHVKFEQIRTVIRDERKPTFEVETVGVTRNPELLYEDDEDDE